jgi:rRNA maturation RNase YbeY
VTPETIRKVNKEYLDHDYTTDIITFNYSDENYKFDGEIFISFDDALSNAKKFGCKVETELLRLVVHGILHLMGYDDIQESDKKEMKKIENDLVDQYKFLTKNTVII